MFLTADQIFAADDLPHEDVYVPEWRGNVRIRRMGAADKWRTELAILRDKEANGEDAALARTAARWVVASAINEQGEKLFKPDDVDKLAAKCGDAVERLMRAVQRLNPTQDQAEKNSASAPQDDSSSV